MIRALFGFVLTLGLIGAAALWALRSFDPAVFLSAAAPPVSRTVELVAAELGERLANAVENEARPALEPTAALSPPQPADPSVVNDENVPEPTDPLAHDGLETPSPAPANRVAERDATLADSAVLVRRMLGLYERSLAPR